LLLLALAVAAATWLVQHHVLASAEVYLYAVADVPEADCILVPGARISSTGEPYPMLVDRLAVAVELFRLGRAPRIVVSGRGGGGRASDEVAAMRRWLQARGVAAAAIQDDPLGLRTIDSLRRCRAVYHHVSAIVVSNDFHVPRMVFLGRYHGLQAFGVAAPPLFHYSSLTLWKNRGREVLARVRACFDVYCRGVD
jgi:SanA protein